jgi:threonine aldolase
MPQISLQKPIKKQSYRRRQSGQKIAQPTTLALQVVTKLEHSALDRQ